MKVNRWLVIFIMTFLVQAFIPIVYAQSGYYDYPGSQKIDIFFDDFRNNDNGWAVGVFGGGARQGTIKDGYYEWQSLRTGDFSAVWKTLTLNEERDFEIEADIKYVRGEDNNANCLFWGRNSSDYRFRFGFSGNGQYIIDKYDGKWTSFVPWTKSPLVKSDAYNTLTVRKVQRTYYFFLNRVLVHTMPVEPFFDQYVGFQVNQNTVINIDSCRVSYLNLEQEASYGHFTASDRKSIFFDDFVDNKNDWPVGIFGGGQRKGTIENGYYEWRSLVPTESSAVWKMIPFNETKDFEIEAGIRYLSGQDNNANCLFWGRNSSDYRFRFGFSGNGQYIIDKNEGQWKNFVSWTQTALVNKYSYNIITVRKVGKTYYFFLNKRLVHTMPFEPFFDHYTGFQANYNSAIRVDYVRLSYLERESYNEPPVIIITRPDISRGIEVLPAEDIVVEGSVSDRDGVEEVTVNDRSAALQRDGRFSITLPLKTGENTVTVKAVDNKKQVAYKTFSVTRTAPLVEPVFAEKRLALVIGNAVYSHGGSLANPVNDARSIAKILNTLGFTAITYENCTQKDMKRAMDEFGVRLKGHQVGLFFYAGHGVQVHGINYLIPVDAKLENQNDVEYDCVRADRILAKMEAAGSRTNIVILDACRDNPFERSWRRGARGSGLAFMNAPSGSLIAYATSPGDTASDGSGRNGIYTSALLKHIETPDITILQMFQRVRTTVMSDTSNDQIPWESTSLSGDFFFRK